MAPGEEASVHIPRRTSHRWTRSPDCARCDLINREVIWKVPDPIPWLRFVDELVSEGTVLDTVFSMLPSQVTQPHV